MVAEAVANKSQSELGSLVAQRNKELARTVVAEFKNIMLQKENERLICDNKKFSSDFAKLKEEKETVSAQFSQSEKTKKELQDVLDKKNKVAFSEIISF